MTPRADAVAAAFEAACRDELEAPKPGNVHVFADGHRMTASEFTRSADAAAPCLAQAGARVGARILSAVEATFAAVNANTNLGIILLCAPLAAAAEAASPDLPMAVARVLAALDVEDADLAFRAIRRAQPAGIGRVERHDVFAPATATLLAAMTEAADRDQVARQYASAFEDVFALGEPVLTSMLPRVPHPRWATLAVYIGFLSVFPDTHIARKYGLEAAQKVRRTAATFRARLQSTNAPDALLPDLLAWDAALKRDAINPGTSADLTVATLFAHRLRSILPPQRISD